jgi:DNA-binding XRE family transcriptional regulator
LWPKVAKAFPLLQGTCRLHRCLACALCSAPPPLLFFLFAPALQMQGERGLRKASNMNQQELADKLHIHVTHLSKMENGHLLPSIDIVQRLMKVFAVSPDE